RDVGEGGGGAGGVRGVGDGGEELGGGGVEVLEAAVEDGGVGDRGEALGDQFVNRPLVARPHQPRRHLAQQRLGIRRQRVPQQFRPAFVGSVGHSRKEEGEKMKVERGAHFVLTCGV